MPADHSTDLPTLWRQRNFMRLWSAMCVSALGSHAAGIAYPLLVLALTGSPATVGMVTALRGVPYLLLCLPVGAMVDRWDRRRVMLRCEAGCGLAVGSLALALALGVVTVPHIVVVALVEGVLSTFFNIAQTAALPKVVPRPQLPQATAWNQAGWAATGVAGPALGSVLFQWSRALPFGVDAVSYLVSAGLLWRLRADFSPPPPAGPVRLWAEVKVGLQWVWHEALVRRLALLTAGSNFVQAAVPLLLIIIAQQMGASASQTGLIFSAAGIGGVLGSLVGAQVQRWLRFGQVIAGTMVIEALLMPLIGACPSWLWLGLVYGLIMFIGPVYNVVQFSHRLALIPPGLEGRVNASYRFIAHLPGPAGAALCGLVIERWGWPVALAGFALVMAALALWALADRVIRHGQHGAARSAAGNPPAAAPSAGDSPAGAGRSVSGPGAR